MLDHYMSQPFWCVPSIDVFQQIANHWLYTTVMNCLVGKLVLSISQGPLRRRRGGKWGGGRGEGREETKEGKKYFLMTKQVAK